MSANKECQFPCPFIFSEEIGGVCPSIGINDQLEALDLCQQVMLGRRKENELKREGKIPIYKMRNPAVVEYRDFRVEDGDTDETPEIKVRDVPVEPIDRENPIIPRKKRRRNRFKEAFEDDR